MSSVYSSTDGTDPAIPKDHYAVPAEVETSDSSASTAGQEVPFDWTTSTIKKRENKDVVDWTTAKMSEDSPGMEVPGWAMATDLGGSKKKQNGDVVDWTTAKMVEDSPDKEVPIKKKRTRSFGKKLFGGTSHKPRAYKTDRKLDFTMIESPLKSPMPVHLQYDSSVASESTYGYSQPDEDVAPTSALSIKSRSIKKLACSMQSNEARDEETLPSWVKEDDDSAFSNPFDSIDPYLAVEEKEEESEGENTRASNKSAKSNFSIPLSSFVKKSSDVSWGVSAVTEAVSDMGSEMSNSIIQETHWGKFRSRSRGSASWVPTEEERYQILQGFDHGEDEAKNDDDDESRASATTGAKTEVTGDTGITLGSEYTNETTSAYTGYYSADSASSYYTDNSYVTGTTGEASMFSLEVDDSSKSTEATRERSRRRASARRRRKLMAKPEQNLLVEVFADIRLLAQDLAAEEPGFSGCFRCS
jgi:hypothetical protein